MFLDRHIQNVSTQWGPTDFYTKQAEEYKNKALAKWRNGEVIMVDTYDYNAAYGNGTGSYSKELWSDGTIRTGCYGYVD